MNALLSFYGKSGQEIVSKEVRLYSAPKVLAIEPSYLLLDE